MAAFYQKINQSAHITVQWISGTKPREVRLGQIADVLGAEQKSYLIIIDTLD
jgi:cell division protein FtsA